jgi:Cu2+-exporting ATPase
MDHSHHHNHEEHLGDSKNEVAHLGHMDHERAMTDPSMAKEMEADMRRRFFISLALTLPIIFYSPMGEMLFAISLASPIPKNLLLFLLTTPIVFWTGSIFITGLYYSLKARKLNMSVLIATGVLAAYLGSITLAIYGSGEAFYEAAAMLVTFVLFGHWMEMRSRRGTSDSLRTLFDLVPPQAQVIRDGKEVLISSAKVVMGDIVVVKPGDKIPAITGRSYCRLRCCLLVTPLWLESVWCTRWLLCIRGIIECDSGGRQYALPHCDRNNLRRP